MYHSHFPKIVALGEEPHLNTSFKVGRGKRGEGEERRKEDVLRGFFGGG